MTTDLDALACGRPYTVQGEPTDAQVEAALQALGHARSAVMAPAMRAALRAAAEQGGND